MWGSRVVRLWTILVWIFILTFRFCVDFHCLMGYGGIRGEPYLLGFLLDLVILRGLALYVQRAGCSAL